MACLMLQILESHLVRICEIETGKADRPSKIQGMELKAHNKEQ